MIETRAKLRFQAMSEKSGSGRLCSQRLQNEQGAQWLNSLREILNHEGVTPTPELVRRQLADLVPDYGSTARAAAVGP